MKIVMKENETADRYPNYWMENGWGIVIEQDLKTNGPRYNLWLGNREIALRNSQGGWYVFPSYNVRYTTRPEAVAAYLAWRMTK